MRNSWVAEGVKCRCIDATWRSSAFYGHEHLPVEGEIYTVRNVYLPDGKTICIRLVELVNDPMEYGEDSKVVECSFAAWHFRPLVDEDAKQSREYEEA